MKKMLGVMLAAIVLVSTCIPSFADTMYGKDNWSVKFTSGKEMTSTFKTKDMDDIMYGLQPGDNAIIELALKNEYSEATDWYMSNKVLYSLEDRSKNDNTAGGAYTYKLVYTDASGKEKVLFSSEEVGGDTISKAGEGLHEATDALDDFFYLDTFATGKGGKITLEVALDGETQGNDYQDTLADLQMNFAVEINEKPVETTEVETTPEVSSGEPTKPSKKKKVVYVYEDGKSTTYVKTGDDTNLKPFVIAATGIGTLLLIVSIMSIVERMRRKKEAK